MSQRKIKKDFDKEKMYQKIMPTFASSLSESVEGTGEPPVPEKAGDTPPETERAAAKKTPEIPELPQEKPRTAAPRYVLRNFIEDLVLERLNHTIQMLKGCECEKCKKDVMAMALNSLPPAYVAVLPEELDATVGFLRSEHDIKVAAALIKAVQAVKKNPRHD